MNLGQLLFIFILVDHQHEMFDDWTGWTWKKGYAYPPHSAETSVIAGDLREFSGYISSAIQNDIREIFEI